MKFILFFLIPILCNAQIDTAKAVAEEDSVAQKFSYVNYEYSYKIEIPEWLNQHKEELPQNMFGGTFPLVDAIENAVVITGFSKDKYENFKDFERIFMTGNKFGQPALFYEEFKWYGRNERDFKKIKNGVSSRVFYIYKNKVYHNQFVLLETKTSYLFVHFCSTPETYDKNIKKFDEFLKGLKLIE